MPPNIAAVLFFFVGFLVGKFFEPIVRIINLIRKDMDRAGKGKSKKRDWKK